jgi:hypothetical protein
MKGLLPRQFTVPQTNDAKRFTDEPDFSRLLRRIANPHVEGRRADEILAQRVG